VSNRCAAVHNDPLAVFLALDPGFCKTVLAHLVSNTGRQGLGLAIGSTGGNDDSLKQRGDVLGVEDRDIGGFDVL